MLMAVPPYLLGPQDDFNRVPNSVDVSKSDKGLVVSVLCCGCVINVRLWLVLMLPDLLGHCAGDKLTI